eukprot:Pgem_evm1s3686
MEEKQRAHKTWADKDVEIVDSKAISLEIIEQDVCKPQQLLHHNLVMNTFVEVFKRMLVKYPNDQSFIFLEDDAMCLDYNQFKKELCVAQDLKLSFYSFYKVSTESSCLYEWGLQSFYITRQLTMKFANSNKAIRCRMENDMLISSWGPFYATTNYIVGHYAKGFQRKNLVTNER